MMRARKRTFTAALGLLAAAMCGQAVMAQEAVVPYRTTQRDPFINYKVYFKRKSVRKEQPKPIPEPSIEVRIEQYKAQKRAAVTLQQQAPKPTTALLIKEVEVMGIFRTPRGYAAMVEATPIKLSYVIYPGEPFFDGTLVAIEENRLVFRRETPWSDGRRDVSVESKQLRKPDIKEVMTAPKTEEAAHPAPAPGNAPAAGDNSGGAGMGASQQRVVPAVGGRPQR